MFMLLQPWKDFRKRGKVERLKKEGQRERVREQCSLNL